MNTAVVEKEIGQVARPLKILVPLIQQDFAEAEKAGMAYYKAAGEKLNEARDGHFDGDTKGFYEWSEKTFGKKRTQIRTYMALVSTDSRKTFKNLDDFRRKAQGYPTHSAGKVYREWTAPVDNIAEKARNEARRLAAHEEALTRQQERQAEAKLGLRLIDIGWKVLAQELHPDKVGGSREAMTRLNRVRDRLKANV